MRRMSLMVSWMLPWTLFLSCCFVTHSLSVGGSSSSSSSSSMMKTPSTAAYDLVVIGGGSAGLTAAKLAATFDKSVVIIEQDRMGGDCTWTGCIPSKTLLASAKVAHVARNSERYGVSTGGAPRVDMEAVRNLILQNIQEIYQEDDSPEAMAKLGIDTCLGKATFLNATTLAVESQNEESALPPVTIMMNAKQGVVVCTGAKPKRPTSHMIQGIQNVEYLTYEEVFDLKTLPNKMTVVGGGPIGCELSQAFARLGSQVTLVAQTLVPREEPEASETLESVFAKEGITRIKASLTSVKPSGKKGGGHEGICTHHDGTTETISGDALLVAVGRAPNVQDFGLREIGVTFNDKSGIQVNDKLQTNVKNVYAAGDCTGDLQFTHYAGYQGAIAARNILLPLKDQGVIENVPSATFTSPEISSIGLTEEMAKIKHGVDNVAVKFQPLSHVDRAICDGEKQGFIKIVYSKKNYQILGATVMSPAAGELISEIGVAIKSKTAFPDLSTVIHSYPTYSIALQMMASDVNYEKTLKSKTLLNILKWIGL